MLDRKARNLADRTLAFYEDRLRPFLSSGDPTPSAEDVHVTKQIVEAGRMLSIEVLDHLVLGQGKWVSLKERGLGF